MIFYQQFRFMIFYQQFFRQRFINNFIATSNQWKSWCIARIASIKVSKEIVPFQQVFPI